MTSKTTEEHLTNLLTNPKTFSISSYLNTALLLNNEEEESSSATTSTTITTKTKSTTATKIASFEDENLQRKMAELALQLQVQTQSCHDEIGRIGAELRAILPRCAGDLGRLNVGLGGMKEDAETLLEEHLKSSLGYVDKNNSNISNNDKDGQKNVQVNNNKHGTAGDENEENVPPSSEINNETSTSMTPLETLETLSTLHALQQNLTTTKSILHSVSTYDKTITSLPSLLTSSQNLNHAVNALVTLEEGAKALSGMPGQAQREEEIAMTRKKILTLLKPELLHALKKMESRLGPLQTCVGMYSSLGKIESLMEEYVKNRPSSVHRLWFEFGKHNKISDNVDTVGPLKSKSSSNDELENYGDNLQHDKELFGDHFDHDTKNDESVVEQEKIGKSFNEASFVEWLPTWYEAVLLLLSEEQRRALTVFGPTLAPEIMAKILHECFRPIISSFKARLAAILPSHSQAVSSLVPSGSFEKICVAYEATLQFLSVAYESMVDFTSSHSSDSNDKSSSSLRTKTPLELYKMIRSTFIAIGSPFVPYQENYADFESNHSGMTARVVSRDIHDAVTLMKVGNTTSLLQGLQDSVEKLTSLAPFIFPLAEAAMARFESFNSGYVAPKALSVMDTLIARHTGELSIAIHTLSTNVLSYSEKLSDTFDEQQVQYALEVLKIAGLIRRDLMAFEEKTRDRLRILMGRVSAAIEEECNVRAATSSNTWSQVPDSLSAAEIEAILAMMVCRDENDNEGLTKSPSILVLQRLVSPDKVGKKVALFPESMVSVSRLVRSCQSFVFDICAAVPMKHLDGMSMLPVWRQEESLWSSTPDSYGTLPQSHITQVGEHMLALVQALEPFASDKNALMLANQVMEGVEHVSMKSWKSFIDAISCDDITKKEDIIELMKGVTFKELVLHQDASQGLEEEEDLQDEAGENAEMHAFCNKWLDAVCTAVTGKLLDRTMRIQYLSRKGCDHLSVDYNYIINVFSALGVLGHPHPILSHIAQVYKLEAETARDRIASFSLKEQSVTVKIMSKMESRITEMRGSR